MRNVPAYLTNELQRLGDDSRIAPSAGRVTEGLGEIEELVDKAIHLYGRLNRQHELWAMPIRQSHALYNLEEARKWQATFQAWCDDARRIIDQAQAFEARGHKVDQLEGLRSTLMHCDYDGIDIEQLAKSAQAASAGGAVPAQEVHDAIQRRLRAGRSEEI